MAKITGPLMSLGASGSLAKTLVASKWKGRPYMRQHVVPANPQSAAQSTTRNTFANASEMWKLGGPLLVAPWNRFASGQVLSGRNAFQGRFVLDNRGAADLSALVFSPGAKGGLPADSMVVTPGVGTLTVDVTEPAIPTGWTLAAAIVAAVKDQDPETGTLWNSVEGQDAATPFQVVLSSLDAVLYRVGAWLQWTKPDGSTAYGASILSSGTPT